METIKENDSPCVMEATLKVIGNKWKPLILYYLFYHGTQRFNQLQRLVGDITPHTLTRQLRELEADGIVLRQVFAQVPPKVEYSLTKFGTTLEPVLVAMHEWGNHLDGAVK